MDPHIISGAPLTPPHGINEILTTFGNIGSYISSGELLQPRWQSDFMATANLPFPLKLAWDPTQSITRITCHRLLTSIFPATFDRIQQHGLQASVTSFGGCFAFRPQRTGNKLSSHSWGIAIDLNSESNPQGSAGNMHPGLIDIFRSAGFSWGGDWQGHACDPMHFQFCTGY